MLGPKQIDLPNQKEILWHRMRSDLKSLVPWFHDDDLLFCPTCCRPLKFENFSVEHIIPKQALSCDPVDVRNAIPQNERSGLTLLCSVPLVLKGKRIPGHGCNSWKGKYFDPYIRELVKPDFHASKIHSRHQVSLLSAGYLALFRKFGYQVALSHSGLLLRRQFFSPNAFLKDMPLNCQMILAGAGLSKFDEDLREYWSEPFKIQIEGATALIVVRSVAFRVPISRDPSQPIARSIPYAPSRFRFRPDLSTVFE